MEPRVFRVTDEYFRWLRRLHLTYTIPLIAVGVAVGMLSTKREGTGWGPTIVASVFLVVVLAVTMSFTVARQVKQWRSFQLTITPTTVTRTQDGYSTVEFNGSDIRRIRATPGRGLAIWTAGSGPVLGIPQHLERFDDCRALLSQWCQVEEAARQALMMRLKWPLGLTLFAAIFYVNRSADPRIVVPLTLALIVAMLMGWRNLRVNPEIDERTKRMSWVFFLVVAQLLMRMFAVVTAAHGR